jgi:uncharacterized cupin superfamily protein
MERVSRGDLEPTVLDGATARHELSEPLGTTHLAVNRYRVPPGGGLPGGLHAHMDQEEVFVVLEGVATFETLTGDVTVEAGETVRFAPGEFHSGRNGSADPLVVLALGAPRESDDVRVPLPCPACGFDNRRLATDAGDLQFVCPDCGTVQTPGACPSCGGEDLHVTLDDGPDPVVVCQHCEAVFEQPPLRS